MVRAQDVSPSDIPSPTAVVTPTPVDYTMPYPGILPGHTFYSLKLARDRIMGFLISNPVKKAEFDLLQADKRVEASYILVTREKNKTILAESTLSKGLNYFEEGIANASEAKKEGMDVHEVVLNMGRASQKYLEMIKEMQEKIGKKEAKQFEKDRLRSIELGKRVKAIRP